MNRAELIGAGPVSVVVMHIDGREVVCAAPIGDRDPMAVTIGEWESRPDLSAIAMLNRTLRASPDNGGER